MLSESLPDAELEVLACLKNHGPATAKEVREKLSLFRPMTHGAMVTLLKRLESKGLVTKRKAPVGKAFIFEPVPKANETFKRSFRDMLQRIFAGNSIALVNSLFETKPPTLEEVEQLQKMLEQMRRKNKGQHE